MLDRVHTALQSQRALRFVSFVYDPARRRVFSEYTLVVSPKGLLWSEEGYHLLGWNHRSKSLALYRTDRMSQVLVTGMPAQGPNPDPALWTAAPSASSPTGGSGCGFAAAALWRMKSSTVWGQQSS